MQIEVKYVDVICDGNESYYREVLWELNIERLRAFR